ncbi:phage tail protein [Selenomonas ruminantium]|uniref:phage tail protein n=1 Tax=Selenomonas ruminantium TaxID=971 RepID=UPI00040A42A6|nr:phage tail protein [Selenomonas ruminantium]
MSLEVDLKDIEKAKRLLGLCPLQLELAQAAAMNRAILGGRTALSKGIREQYIIPASTVKGKMTMKKARGGLLQASLTVKGSPIDLMKFRTRISKHGVFAQVKRGGGGSLPHSFFVGTGRAGIYHRASESRLPIQREFGPSVPQMAGERHVSESVSDRMKEVMETRLSHEISVRLERLI